VEFSFRRCWPDIPTREFPTRETGYAVKKSVFGGGNAVYGLAKALDEHKDLLQWTLVPFSYNSQNVWKCFEIPLHPGAARYYKEKGYMR